MFIAPRVAAIRYLCGQGSWPQERRESVSFPPHGGNLVRCASCNRDNGADVSFCTHCGSRLKLACPRCGRLILDDSSFCGGCGQRLSDPAPGVPREPAPPSTPASVAPPALPVASIGGRYQVRSLLGEGAR